MPTTLAAAQAVALAGLDQAFHRKMEHGYGRLMEVWLEVGDNSNAEQEFAAATRRHIQAYLSCYDAIEAVVLPAAAGAGVDVKDYPQDHPVAGDLGSVPL